MNIPMSIPNQALCDLFLITNAYGAFLKERELVKKLNKENNTDISDLLREIESNRIDNYAYSYEEEPSSYCLSNDTTDELKSLAKKTVDNKKNEINELFTKNLISSEKYYKKLKHQFIGKYPELEDTMKAFIQTHTENVQNHKRSLHKKHNDVINLSKSFIAFLHVIRFGSDGSHYAFRSFFRVITKKYNLKFDDKALTELAHRFDSDPSTINKAPEKMSVEEIDFLANILGQMLDNISEEDFTNGKIYVCPTGNTEEKGNLAIDIITKKLKHYEKLYQNYKVVRKEFEQIL